MNLGRGEPRSIAHLSPVIVCCLFLFPAGCNVTTEKNQPVAQVHAESDISASSEQARLRMRAMVHPMSSVLVASADQIIASTTDRGIRRAALLWKIEAVPALREALFLPNPLGALGDTWVLTFQMTDYFEKGPGAKALGDARGIAAGASRRLEAEVARVAASMTVSGDVSDVRQYARKWAADHPIAGSIAGRESLLSDVTEREWARSFSVPEAVGNVMVMVDDLNRRVEIYSAQLVDQTRWQAELLAMNLADEYQLNEAAKMAGHAMDVLDRTIPAVERSLAVVERTPALVTAERQATIKAMSAELTRTMAFIQEERVLVLKQITAERTAAVRDVGDALTQERKLLTQDIDAIALRAVDRAFFRAVELCVGLLLAVFVGLVLLMPLIRRVFVGPRGTLPPPRR